VKRIKFNRVGIYESETGCEKANLARRNDDHCVADFQGTLSKPQRKNTVLLIAITMSKRSVSTSWHGICR